ncbi:venom acid phosphatase Acph-1-like isoform X1 [Phymastichus coffea]|uniref:venom acid phosphatase Acph-1-like isoform X1 n=1 Tax=Phymastichus coffea TaxID=108790 RepID=UPI00273CE98E|nr:venom acid phosphatase Acph-1-like isoform X1 [Phymastichus coffea]
MAIGRIQLGLLLLCCSLHSILATKELQFLHVLSVNKFYVPDFNQTSKEFQIPSNLSYSYFLNNAVDLPNTVKMKLFNLGEQLRFKYGHFIGSLYSDEVIRMQTVGFPVSIMAGELINAGLWPPVEGQIWKDDLAWQPVPFEYRPVDEDTLLLGILCPNFEKDTRKVIKDHYNLSSTHGDLLRHIKENGKINVKTPLDVLMLHLAFDNGKELHQNFPKWISELYPTDALTNLTLTAYDLLSTTKLQKHLNGGSLLKTIVNDWQARVNGTLHKDRKIHVFSGDDRNLAGVMKNLNLTMTELPTSGEALIFELWSEANRHYVQVIRYMGNHKFTYPHKLPGCEIYCPVEKFRELVANVLPVDELSLCGSVDRDSGKGLGQADKKSASSISIANALLSFASLVLLYFSAKV